MEKSILRYATIFVIGALTYGLIEISVRGYTHISMGILGGMCMLMIDIMNSFRRKGLSLGAALVFMTMFITLSELVSGIILNINMRLNIWDYSNMPFNYRGQICLPFMFLWFLLSGVGILADEFLRWKFFRTGPPLIFQER